VTLRIRLDLAYDGGGFHGWAEQVGLRTVEGSLREAIERIVRAPVRLTVAGRTDAGVHACGQVAHLDLTEAQLAALAGRHQEARGDQALARRLNAILDHDVRVLAAGLPGDGFDARFSAAWRAYRYRIADQPHTHNPLERAQVWWTRPLADELMAEAALPLTGYHDFAAFAVPRPGGSSVRELFELRVTRPGEGRLHIQARADAFCHHMVRFLVGSLVSVGLGRRPVDWPGRALAARMRDGGLQLAPAHGLTLEAVGYPEGEAAQAARAQESRARREPLP
jgi:tRNA pseudouridine38-40 synthase